MTDSIREQVLTAFFAKLNAISGVTGLQVERNRDLAVDSFPTLVMLDGSQSPNNENSAFTLYQMQVDVEGYVRSSVAANVGADLNALLAKTGQAALADRTLGGLTFDIEEGEANIVIDRAEGVAPNGAFSISFNITYYTKQGDPYTLAP